MKALAADFFAVAVIGGIAAGKTAVTRRFEMLGVPVHDADIAARAVVAPGSAGLADIVAQFGPQALSADGGLNRTAMRERIFADPKARATLETIVHPRIQAWLREQTQRSHDPYALLAIPLLTERRGAYAWLNRILLVEAPELLRVERLITRDGITSLLAQQMLASQANDETRRKIADDVLNNTGAETDLDQAVAALHQRYLQLAASNSNPEF